MIQYALEKILSKADLSMQEAEDVMTDIMTGRTSPPQTAAYLVALRAKGETSDEITGSVKSLREHGIKVHARSRNMIDVCGTGGDGRGTFNISTTSAFVVAGAGVKVAKHGNRAASSRCGSADLLEALGVKIDLEPEAVSECIENAGVGFMFAPKYHPAMKYVVPVRRDLGIRTLFNLIGPLANPAGVTRQLIGVFDRSLLDTFAEALFHLGAERALVLHGGGGFDEATTAGPVEILILESGKFTRMIITPEEMGFSRSLPEQLAGGSAEENAAITLSILNGEPGARTDSVLMNSALCLLAAGKVEDPVRGVELARESLFSGRAANVLFRMREHTRGVES